MSLTITRVETPADKYSLKCTNPMTPTRIVIHNTANDASAMAEISYMLSNSNWTSFHYAVDDQRAVQGLPLNRNGWHAGDGSYGAGNREGIGIEICYSLSGGARFAAAERNGAKLTALLLAQYGWGIDRVTKHQDYTGKYCPHRTLNEGWTRFLGMVKEELAVLTGQAATPAPEEKPTTTISVGGKVKIIGVNYATGQTIPAWVKGVTHIVARIDDQKALLGSPGGINSWVGLKDIEKV